MRRISLIGVALVGIMGLCGFFLQSAPPAVVSGIPAPAAAAGFTQQIVKADFTQTTGFWANTANYITNCGARDSVPNQPTTWHFTSFDWPSRNALPCLPYTQLVTDSGSQVLQWQQPANGSEHDQDLAFPHKVGGAGPTDWLPLEYYAKVVVRMDNAGIQQSPSASIKGEGVFWSTTTTYAGGPWVDEDFTEFSWLGPPTAYRFEGQFQESDGNNNSYGCCLDTAYGAIDLSSGYHTLETLVTSDEISTVSMCIWWDGVLVPTSGNSCVAKGLVLGNGYGYTARDRSFYLGLNTINNGGAPPPNAPITMYIKSIELWGCPTAATGTCPGTIVNH